MICPKCLNSNNISTDWFCYRDGTRLIEDSICLCGRHLIPQFKFCPQCGRENAQAKELKEAKEIENVQTQPRS